MYESLFGQGWMFDEIERLFGYKIDDFSRYRHWYCHHPAAWRHICLLLVSLIPGQLRNGLNRFFVAHLDLHELALALK